MKTSTRKANFFLIPLYFKFEESNFWESRKFKIYTQFWTKGFELYKETVSYGSVLSELVILDPESSSAALKGNKEQVTSNISSLVWFL